MALGVAIQMDPIERIDIAGDSTFALALEAQARGHALTYYGPRDLTFRDGAVVARTRPLEVRNKRGDHFTLGDFSVTDLSRLDVVLMRQDPPFDMAYITATHLLERIHPKTLVVNDPFHVRNAPEKLFVTQFKELMPPTLITTDRAEIAAFRAVHNDIILKPLYGNGGAGVFRVRADDENLGAMLEMFTAFYREPLMVQRYVPQVRKGDKRILLVDGEFAGAINRVPAEGEARSNMHVGARLAFSWHAVDGAGEFAVHQEDALVAFAHLRHIALHHEGLAIEGGEHFQHGAEILVVRPHAKHASAAIAVERLQDDVVMHGAEGRDLRAIRGDQGRRHQLLELGDEQFLRRIAHMERIVDHQRLGVNALQEVRGRDVGHIEGRVLAHQHHVEARQVGDGEIAQGEMIAPLVAHFERPGARHHGAVAEGEIARTIIGERVAARLRFQRQRESRIAGDVNPLDRVHLDGNAKRHVVLNSAGA